MTRRGWILVAGLLLVVVSGCGGDDDDGAPTPGPTAGPTATVTVTESAGPSPSKGATDQPPTTYDEAVARIEAGTPQAGETPAFVTRGGIYCGLAVGSAYAGCELGDTGIEDAEACAGAPTRFVGRVEIQGGKGVPVCNTDTIRADAPTLEDGRVATTRDTQCLTETIGVTCVSRSGSGGFFLGPDEFTVF